MTDATVQLQWDQQPPEPRCAQLILNETCGSLSEGDGQLIRGDNLAVMNHCLERHGACFDMIYLDPPFATGKSFNYEVRTRGKKLHPKAYSDRWSQGLSSYLNMMQPRLQAAHKLLTERGSLYVHCDTRVSHVLRFILDDIFGPEQFINEVIWFYKTGGRAEKIGFQRKHDTILFYTKDRHQAIWNLQKEKSYLAHKYGFSNIDILKDKNGLYTLVNARDVMDIAALRGNQDERVDYPTQKPLALLERLVSASTHPGSWVADFFCGSGTTALTAAQLGRRWLVCDQSPWAIQCTRKRLLSEAPEQGFEVFQDSALKDVPQPRLRYRVERQGTTRRVRLTDFTASQSQEQFSHWSEALDEWAIDTGPNTDASFRCAWRSHRSRKQSQIERCSPYFERGQAKQWRVRAVDRFGAVVVKTLPIRA